MNCSRNSLGNWSNPPALADILAAHTPALSDTLAAHIPELADTTGLSDTLEAHTLELVDTPGLADTPPGRSGIRAAHTPALSGIPAARTPGLAHSPVLSDRLLGLAPKPGQQSSARQQVRPLQKNGSWGAIFRFAIYRAIRVPQSH
jgi:hypothetical protein